MSIYETRPHRWVAGVSRVVEFRGPPFHHRGGTDVARSHELRRYYFERATGNFAWVDDAGRLMRGASVRQRLIQDGHDPEPALKYILDNHLVKVHPFGYEGVVFWRSGKCKVANLHMGTNLSHLL